MNELEDQNIETDFQSFAQRLRAVKNALPDVPDPKERSHRRFALKKPLMKLFDKESPMLKFISSRVESKNYAFKAKFLKS